MRQNILVTGGAGYIGSHACKAIEKAGYVPVTVDNLSTGWSQAVRFGPFENIDLLDRGKLNAVFEKYKPAAVMHFAAFSEVGQSVKEPGKYWRNNFLGSLNLIEIALDNGCKKFINSSTCATYGDHDNVSLTEETHQIPGNPYGASKRAVDEMFEQFAVSHGLNFVIFRYFNVAGADEEAEIGEFHQPETHLIPLLINSADGEQKSFTIFGTDYETADGTCIRDYVHVSDIIDAHILGLEWLQCGKGNRTYNLGTGRGFSVLEVAEAVRKVTGLNIKLTQGSRRAGDCKRLVSGSTLAKVELGWEPRRSTLEKMVKDAWRWHKNNYYQNKSN